MARSISELKEGLRSTIMKIEDCIGKLVKARLNHDGEAEHTALYQMESLMVGCEQDLSVCLDYLEGNSEYNPVKPQVNKIAEKVEVRWSNGLPHKSYELIRPLRKGVYIYGTQKQLGDWDESPTILIVRRDENKPDKDAYYLLAKIIVENNTWDFQELSYFNRILKPVYNGNN